MSKFKRTNKKYMVDILVSPGDQALATGALVDGTTSLGIADGQLGVLSEDFDGATTKGNFITAGQTVTDVSAVRVIQGTPNSNNLSNVDIFEVGHKAYKGSGIIHRDNIKSVTTILYHIGSYSSQVVTSISDPTVSTEYLSYVYLSSLRDDRDYSDNDNVIHTLFEAPASLAGVNDPADLLVQNTLRDLNVRSRLVSTSGNTTLRGNKNVIGFALSSAGSAGYLAGPTLGSITNGTSIPVMVDGGITTNFIADWEFVHTVGHWINDVSTLTGASTIELIDTTKAGEGIQAVGTITMTVVANLAGDTFTIDTAALVEGVDWARGASETTAATALAAAINADTTIAASATSSGTVVTVFADEGGAAGNSIVFTYTDGGSAGATISGAGTLTGGSNTHVDAFVVMGLDHPLSAIFDDIEERRTNVKVNLGDSWSATAAPTIVKINSEKSFGLSRAWDIENKRMHQLTVHTMQNHPYMEFIAEGQNYIDLAKNYTSTVVEYFDYEETLTTREYNPKKLVILLPAEISSAFGGTAADAATNIAASNPAITTLTSNDAGTGTASANVVAGLNASLGAWLDSARTYTAHAIKGDASTGANFV